MHCNEAGTGLLGHNARTRRYNLVVGAYILSEETLPEERLRLIDQLWGEQAGG